MAIDTATETARIDAAKRQLENSVRAREEARRDLLASDGATPIHQPPEHARRMTAIDDAFAARAAVAAGVAGDVLAGVEAARLSEHADPLAALDLAQLNLANQYAVFVKEDCASMPLPALIGRLEFPMVLLGMATMALVVGGAFSHLHRVRLIAGRTSPPLRRPRDVGRLEPPE